MSLSAAYSDRLREVVGVDHERVPDAHRHDLAARADADAAGALVALLAGLLGAARCRGWWRSSSSRRRRGRCRRRRSPSRRCRRRSRSPSSSLAVAERGDQVAGVEDRVRLVVVPGGRRHARVARVVVDVEGAVAVAVVLRAGADAVLRQRQLAAVERDLLAQAAVVPADAGVEDRDLHARGAGRVLPGAVGRDARDLAERVAAGERVLRRSGAGRAGRAGCGRARSACEPLGAKPKRSYCWPKTFEQVAPCSSSGSQRSKSGSFGVLIRTLSPGSCPGTRRARAPRARAAAAARPAARARP